MSIHLVMPARVTSSSTLKCHVLTFNHLARFITGWSPPRYDRPHMIHEVAVYYLGLCSYPTLPIHLVTEPPDEVITHHHAASSRLQRGAARLLMSSFNSLFQFIFNLI